MPSPFLADAPIRWGILGTGRIAGVFTEDLLRLPGHQVVAVGSRAPHTAKAFAERHGIAKSYGSYEALAADDEIDVVYVATPHTGHFPHAMLCLEAGRAVLVEKPFATNAADAGKLVTAARDRGLFALEAFVTRFNPLIRRLRALVADGAIGEVSAVYADIGFPFPYDPSHRIWSSDTAGGALLDLGVYPLMFASMLLGAPGTVQATASFAANGVDAGTAMLLGYDSGAIALLHCGLVARSPATATVIGTTGRIEVAGPFSLPSAMTVHRAGAPAETFTIELEGNGYTGQAEEVARCLRAGEPESPLMPLDETLAILRVVDTVAASHASACRGD